MRGHVQKRGSRYRGVIYLGRDANRKKKYRYLPTVPTEEQAQLMVADTIGELNRGTYVEQSKMTFGELLDRWVAHKSRRGRRDSTIRWYSYVARCYLKPIIGHIQLQRLTPLDLERCYDEVQKRGREVRGRNKEPGEPLSDSTVRACHRVIHACLRQAVKWKLVAANSADAVEPPESRKQQRRVLDVAQAKALIDAAYKGSRHPELYILALTTGMRRGELLGLRWKDIEPPLAYVRQAVKKSGPNPVFEAPKTQAGERPIWLVQQALEALEAVRVKQQAERVLRGAAYEDHDLVFAQPDGRPLHGHNISRREFKRLLAIAGLPDMKFHELRHTGATLMLQAGVPLKVVSMILGHAQIGVTADTYTHVLLDVLKDAAGKLERLLFGKEGES